MISTVLSFACEVILLHVLGQGCFTRDVSLTCVPGQFVFLYSCLHNTFGFNKEKMVDCRPICLTVMSPAVVEVGELCVVWQIKGSAADPTVCHMVTSVPPGCRASARFTDGSKL